MKYVPQSGLHRQLLFYTAFIGIVFLTMAIEMTFFIRGERVLGILNTVHHSNLPEQTMKLILLKMGLMLSILLLAIGLVMLLFTKRIMFPLKQIIEGTRAMSYGDFSITLPDKTRDELGELSRRINDLTANHQELILLTRNMTEQTHHILCHGADDTRVEDAVKKLDDLTETLEAFGRNFYQC